MGKKYISSLAGLKVMAILCIFWWHSPLPNPVCDIGARACEFFFVSSGFLCYYAHYEKPMPCTWAGSAKYMAKKFVSIWPLHLVGFLIVLVCMPISEIFTKESLINAILNLSLVQAWINYASVFFSYNGATWFLSALVFCYFMTPLFLRILHNPRKAVILFPITFMVRFAIEYIQSHNPGVFWDLNIHVSPIVRVLEFFMGMMVAVAVTSVKCEKLKFRRLFFSLLEIVGILATIFLMVNKEGIWYRAEFVLVFCVLILIFSFDFGLLSKILGLYPFRLFANIQFEFYILHQAIIKFLTRYLTSLFRTSVTQAIAAFCIVVILSEIYRFWIKDKAERCMRGILHRFWVWIRN